MSAHSSNDTRQPLYVAPTYRSNVTRTTSPFRPEWLDAIRRPLRIVAQNQRQFERFLNVWRLNHNECRLIAEFDALRGVSIAVPLLILPIWEAEDHFPATDPIALWKQRGGLVIKIPESAMEVKFMEAKFPDDFNLIASTIVQHARNAHLDALNGKR